MSSKEFQTRPVRAAPVEPFSPKGLIAAPAGMLLAQVERNEPMGIEIHSPGSAAARRFDLSD